MGWAGQIPRTCKVYPSAKVPYSTSSGCMAHSVRLNSSSSSDTGMPNMAASSAASQKARTGAWLMEVSVYPLPLRWAARMPGSCSFTRAQNCSSCGPKAASTRFFSTRAGLPPTMEYWDG